MMNLSDISGEALLAELLRRNPPQQGPSRVAFGRRIRVATVGIGKDHSASVYVHTDDLAMLEGTYGLD